MPSLRFAVVQVSVAAAAAIACLAAATQWAAAMLGYQPALGAPVVDLLVGSVTQAVLRRATLPVVVVPVRA